MEEIVGCVHTVVAGRHFISPARSGYLVKRSEQSRRLVKEKTGIATLTPASHRQNVARKLDLHGIRSLVKFAYDNKGVL